MPDKIKILIFGATGYIGGSVLNRIIKHPKASTFEITASVRTQGKAQLLEKLGVKTAIAAHADLDKLEALAQNADVVFNAANSDDLPAIVAVLKGMRKQYESTGKVPILIHTSGTGEIAESVVGERATDVVYSDVDVKQMKSIPPTAFHRHVDLAVISADEQGYVRGHIITPGIVYGIASGAVFDAGIANPISIQIPDLAKAALARRRGGMVGPGKAVWPNVHIDDVADMYLVLYDAIVSNPQSVGHGWEGYYFGENGHHSWHEVAKAIGQVLVDMGLADNAEPTSFTDEELAKFWGTVEAGRYSGTTCRCSADRPRGVGWKPKYTTADLLASVKADVERQWKEAKGGEIDFTSERQLAALLAAAAGSAAHGTHHDKAADGSSDGL